MRYGLRKAVRTAQVYAPWLADTKPVVQRAVSLALRRPFEADFRALRLFAVPPRSLYLDVGANRGQSIDAIRMFSAVPSIVAFEPNQVLANRLTKRYRHSTDVEIRALALGDEPGSFVLHIPIYRRYVFDGLASLDKDSAQQWLQDRVFGFDPARLTVQSCSCEVVRLDDLDVQPAFIKLDVQGYEARVLRGGESTLRKCRPIVLVECPGSELTAYMATLGYQPHAFLEGALVPDRQGELNTFFLPK